MGLGSHIVAWALALGLGVASGGAWLAIAHAPNLDPLVVIILWLNLLVILLAVGVEVGRRPYSLHLMHLVCLFLFLGVASLLQYSAGVFGVAGPIDSVRAQILPAAASTTLWITGYLIAYEGLRFAGGRLRAGAVSRFLSRPIRPLRVFVLAFLGILALAYLAAAGLLFVSTRGAAEAAVENFSIAAGVGRLTSPLYILNINLARSLPQVSLLAILLVLFHERRVRSPALVLVAIVVGVGVLAVNNPFAASRIFFTSTLIGFSAPFFLRRMKTGGLLVLAILAGLAFLPALSASRNVFSLDEFGDYLRLISPLDYLAQNSDVDSLGMTALCQKWVDRHGHQWGLQTLGAFLFWVPRAFWSTKPIATGAMVTEALGFDFTNLAPPITAEALVDFGLVGVPVFAAIFGVILARLDATYWAVGRLALGTSYRIIDAVYPFWLVCIVFLTRGDLFGALTYTTGITVWVLPLGVGLTSFGAAPGTTRAVGGAELRRGVRS